MAIKELIEHLSYNGCNCPVDFKEDLGIVNGVCPRHKKSVLLVKGVRVEVFLRELNKRKLDRKHSEIV